MVGLFDHVLSEYGLRINPGPVTPEVKDHLRCPDEDYYLATYEVESAAAPAVPSPVELYVQAHPDRVADLHGGQYRFDGAELVHVSDDLVRKQDVIAINQEVYDRASFGVSLIGRAPEPWQRYVDPAGSCSACS